MLWQTVCNSATACARNAKRFAARWLTYNVTLTLNFCKCQPWSSQGPKTLVQRTTLQNSCLSCTQAGAQPTARSQRKCETNTITQVEGACIASVWARWMRTKSAAQSGSQKWPTLARQQQNQVQKQTSCHKPPTGKLPVFPDLDLSFLFCPFLSLLGLSRFFWDFPDLLGDSSGIFPICPFPLSRPIKSTYEEQSRKGPRHNLDLSQRK